MYSPQRPELKPGQESVWDYPRPPRVDPYTGHHIIVRFEGITIADTTRSVRILETSHPPGIYIPARDVAVEYLQPSGHHTVCEYKGRASYVHLQVGERTSSNAAWFYPAPNPGYEEITDHYSFYPQAIDEATIDGEVVGAQEGHFYGGWVTQAVVGPFKGSPGTMEW